MKPLSAWRCGTSGFTPDAGREQRALVVLLGLALLPAVAHGQSRIVGQVTDNTGGVLPGVAVEAASPVLIEGSRIAIADSQGRYGIVDLRPGTYEVTFILPVSPPPFATSSRSRRTSR